MVTGGIDGIGLVGLMTALKVLLDLLSAAPAAQKESLRLCNEHYHRSKLS